MIEWFEAGMQVGFAVFGFIIVVGVALVVLWLLAILLAAIAERLDR